MSYSDIDGTLDESPVLPTVSELTGRPPRTFRDRAQEHHAEFTYSPHAVPRALSGVSTDESDGGSRLATGEP